MGQLGRQYVQEHYDIDKLNDRLVCIYQKLLEKSLYSNPKSVAKIK